MNDYFFLQRGERVDLGNGELRSLVRTYQPKATITNVNSRVVLVSGELDIEKITARAACTKVAGRLLQVSNKVTGFELDGMMKNYKTFACSIVNLSKKPVDMQILSKLGNYVKREAPWLNVSLENPDVTVLLIKMETESVIGIVDRRNSVKWKGESRRKRPYFHPVALEPRLCRTMINLAMIREDNTMLDPFCGTGSVMLEANRMKINSIGCDLSSKMCKGALTNLRNSNSFLINCDALSLPLKMDNIDAIVTDLPYGSAASTIKRRPKELLNEFLDVTKQMKGKRCCIMSRKGDEQEFPNIVEQYDIYEHKNLTRKLMVLCN
ncbi:MAG: tRNA (guanine10-N2)-dimethyltransferase [Candidatus Nitrosomirales archaeon]|jgi:tRNA (guanine10-N2)-dimethyltransferase